jgi:DNA-binding LytR/AlgR family response regulator
MEINIAVCDDEHQQTEYIKSLVGKWADETNIKINIEMFDSAENFKSAWNENEKYDVLLLDIQMSGQNGMELAREIRQSNQKLVIIFITGFSDYMSEGYDVAALHYLMKPVKEDKLFEVLDKAVVTIESEAEKILTVTINREDIFIPRRDIIYVESSLHYIIIYTEKEQHKVKMPLAEIENKLGGGFFKCTRSFIVGLRYVRRISKNEVTLMNGVSVPLGRGLYKDINKAFIRYN